MSHIKNPSAQPPLSWHMSTSDIAIAASITAIVLGLLATIPILNSPLNSIVQMNWTINGILAASCVLAFIIDAIYIASCRATMAKDGYIVTDSPDTFQTPQIFNDNEPESDNSGSLRTPNAPEEVKLDPVSALPLELSLEIFSYLKPEEIARARAVNTQWREIGDDPSVKKCPKSAYGKHIYTRYFGDIGREPPLPPNIWKILDSPCPFWPDKTIAETHFLACIAATVDEKEFNLQTLANLLKSPKEGEKQKLVLPWSSVVDKINIHVEKSYWVLMTRRNIPASNDTPFKKKLKLIDSYNKKHNTNYCIPKPLEITTCFAFEAIHEGVPYSETFSTVFDEEETSSFGFLNKKYKSFYFYRQSIGDLEIDDFDLKSERKGVLAIRRLTT